MTAARRLVRSEDKMIAGVCGGVAKFVGWEPVAIRALFVLGTLFSAVIPGIALYILLWWMMPVGEDHGFRLDKFRQS